MGENETVKCYIVKDIPKKEYISFNISEQKLSITNGDKIRAMSDEDLALFYCNKIFSMYNILTEESKIDLFNKIVEYLESDI